MTGFVPTSDEYVEVEPANPKRQGRIQAILFVYGRHIVACQITFYSAILRHPKARIATRV